MQNVFAVSTLPEFDTEASIRTDDEELNAILRTAAYTLKLNFQKGYIWDGIKRDRLVWCGDLNPEILTSLYLFGDTENIRKYCYEKFRHSLCHGWASGVLAFVVEYIIGIHIEDGGKQYGDRLVKNAFLTGFTKIFKIG